MMKSGTAADPLPSNTLEMAHRIRQELFKTPKGRPGLFTRGTGFIVWDDPAKGQTVGQWRMITLTDLEDIIWSNVNGLHVLKAIKVVDDNQELVTMKINMTRQMCAEIIRAIQSISRFRYKSFPCWLKNDPKLPDPSKVAAFQDKLVWWDKEGEISTVKRDEDYMGNVLALEWGDGMAECPNWEKAIWEYAGNDPKWVSLLQMWMGKCLVNYRGDHRWLLMQGTVRGGKSTIVRIIKQLAGKGFVSRAMEDLGTMYGLTGTEGATVLSLGELPEGKWPGEAMAVSNIKKIVGQDTLNLKVKYSNDMPELVSGAAIMATSNPMPKLSDDSQQLSSKMIYLPFKVSFLGREDTGLDQRLERELGGIAAWAIEGLGTLERCGWKWPTGGIGDEEKELFRNENNVWDVFLADNFVQDEDGFVDNQVLKAKWKKWSEQEGSAVTERILSRNVPSRIVRGTSWPIESKRTEKARGVTGMRLRTQEDPE